MSRYAIVTFPIPKRKYSSSALRMLCSDKLAIAMYNQMRRKAGFLFTASINCVFKIFTASSYSDSDLFIFGFSHITIHLDITRMLGANQKLNLQYRVISFLKIYTN